MSCKDGCCKKRANALDMSMFGPLSEQTAWAARQLLMVVRTGITSLFRDDTLNVLAREISQLYNERDRLARIVQAYSGEKIVGSQGVTLRFGPDDKYVLHVPAQRRLECQQAPETQLPLPLEY